MKKNTNKRKKKYKFHTRFKVIVTLLLVFASVIVLMPSDTQRLGTRVVAYLSMWNSSCYKDIDYRHMTDLNIAFINPNSEGDLSTVIPEEDLDDIIAKAHSYGVNVNMSLGGGNGYRNYTNLTSTKDSRSRFNEKILNYAEKHYFDGIDINVEGDVEPAFWGTYPSWVEELRDLCDKNKLILSCSTGSWFDGYISADTFNMFDYISIMAYDDKAAENPSTYDYAADQMEYFAGRGIEEEKLVLGVPFYGYEYQNGFCTSNPVTYQHIAANFKNFFHEDTCGKYRYNGADTIAKKAKLGQQYGGVMIWSIDQDISNKYSLLNVIFETLTENEK